MQPTPAPRVSTLDQPVPHYDTRGSPRDDAFDVSDSVVEQLCRTRLFELFPEVPSREVEDCYMQCGGVLRLTYQTLLERMATPVNSAISFPSTPLERSCRASSIVSSRERTAGIEPSAHAAEFLAELEAERLRAEESTRAVEAEVQRATEQLLQRESTIEAAESARQTAERAATADRLQCEEVVEQLSNIRERVEQLDAAFQQRVRDADAAEAAEDAAEAAAAASLMDRVAKLEASVASTGEALRSAAARRRAAEAEEVQAKAEEAKLRQSIGEMKLQQEQAERDVAEQEEEMVREQKKREELEEETYELNRQRGRVDGELDQLNIQNAPASRRSKAGKSAAEIGGTSTDPNGILALAGEDEVRYIRRQERLKQEAKERMAAKFGAGGVSQGQRQRMDPSSFSVSSSSSSHSTELSGNSTSTATRTLGSSGSATASGFVESGSPSSSGRSSPTRPPASGWLHVTVIACNKVLAADVSGRSNPFIKLHLGREDRTTTACQKTLNPVFNETLVFPISEHGPGAERSSDAFLLRVEVWDKGRHSRDDFLGECSVHLLDLFGGVWCGERYVHRAFGDPRQRLSARERKQAKRRGGPEPCGAVDLRCSFETQSTIPSLAEWLTEKDLARHLQRVAKAMKDAEVPDEQAVPLLAGMDARELADFIDACAETAGQKQHGTLAASSDASQRAASYIGGMEEHAGQAHTSDNYSMKYAGFVNDGSGCENHDSGTLLGDEG